MKAKDFVKLNALAEDKDKEGNILYQYVVDFHVRSYDIISVEENNTDFGGHECSEIWLDSRHDSVICVNSVSEVMHMIAMAEL